MLFAVMFLFFSNLSLASNTLLLWPQVGAMAVNMGYFLIPLLFIRDVNFLKTTFGIVIIITLIGCLSAFFVSTGLLTLPYERFEDSRLGVESLRKSIGLLGSYGNMAQLCAYTVLLTMVLPKKEYLFGYGAKKVKTLIIFSILLGIIGTQSRNIILGIFVAMIALYFVRLVSTKSGSQRSMMVISLFSGFIVSGVIIGISLPYIYDFISSLGGSGAKTTAEGRLSQYEVAFEVFRESPFLGLDASEYLRKGYLIDHVHSLWIGLAARGGILTLLVFIFWLYWSLKGAYKALEEQEKTRYSMIVIAYFATLFVAVSFYPAHRVYLFWLMFGIASSLSCIPGRSSKMN